MSHEVRNQVCGDGDGDLRSSGDNKGGDEMTDILERLRRFAGEVCISTQTELDAADEIERLRAKCHSERLACDEWLEKTKWVQDDVTSGALSSKYLGRHRADVMKAEVERLRAEIAAMRQQEPVAWIGYNGMLYNHIDVVAKGDRPLYLAPGAQGETK